MEAAAAALPSLQEHPHRLGSTVNNHSLRGEMEEVLAAAASHHSTLLCVPMDQRIRDEPVLKMGTDGTWLPRRLVLDAECLYFIRTDDNEEVVIDRIDLVTVSTVTKTAPSQINGSTMVPQSRSTRRSSDPRMTKVLKNHSESRNDLPPARDVWAVEIRTAPADEEFMLGRDYFIRAQSQEALDLWVSDIQAAAKRARDLKAKEVNVFRRVQRVLRQAYASLAVQLVVVALIVANFAVVALHAEQRPMSEENEQIYSDIDMVFTVLFGVEVSINLIGHWFFEFFQDGWNCFDITIVGLSVFQKVFSEVPGLSHIRILRVFRVLRIFGRLEQLRRIVSSITASLVPVLQAFLIGLIVCFIYAVIGVEFFAEQAPASFTNFPRAVYTLFEVVAFQRWTEEVPAFDTEDNSMNLGAIIFIYSYVVVVSWVLLQVVVAVLLENFFSATASDKEQTAKARAIEQRAISSPLDPLLQLLSSQFDTSVDLSNRINTLFEALDNDKEGFLTFNSLRHGLAQLHANARIALSQDDYKAMIDQVPGLSGLTLSPEEFERVIKAQLRASIQRKIADALAMDNCTFEMDAVLTAMKLLLIEEHSRDARNRQDSEDAQNGAASPMQALQVEVLRTTRVRSTDAPASADEIERSGDPGSGSRRPSQHSKPSPRSNGGAARVGFGVAGRADEAGTLKASGGEPREEGNVDGVAGDVAALRGDVSKLRAELHTVCSAVAEGREEVRGVQVQLQALVEALKGMGAGVGGRLEGEAGAENCRGEGGRGGDGEFGGRGRDFHGESGGGRDRRGGTGGRDRGEGNRFDGGGGSLREEGMAERNGGGTGGVAGGGGSGGSGEREGRGDERVRGPGGGGLGVGSGGGSVLGSGGGNGGDGEGVGGVQQANRNPLSMGGSEASGRGAREGARRLSVERGVRGEVIVSESADMVFLEKGYRSAAGACPEVDPGELVPVVRPGNLHLKVIAIPAVATPTPGPASAFGPSDAELQVGTTGMAARGELPVGGSGRGAAWHEKLVARSTGDDSLSLDSDVGAYAPGPRQLEGAAEMQFELRGEVARSESGAASAGTGVLVPQIAGTEKR